MKDVSVLTYSDLVDEKEAVFPHHLLSFHFHVDSGLRSGPHTQLGLIFGAGRSLLERLGQRNSSRVFRRQVAHLTHHSGIGVYIGAELAHPL